MTEQEKDTVQPKSNKQFLQMTRPLIGTSLDDMSWTLGVLIEEARHTDPIGTRLVILELRRMEIMNEIAMRN